MRKKLLTTLIACSVAFLLIARARSPLACAEDTPAPGFTPGFWKHNICVALGYSRGHYSAFEGGPLDGVKLTTAMLQGYVVTVGVTLEEAYDALSARGFPGADQVRADMANALNAVAGYGPFLDEPFSNDEHSRIKPL